MIKVLISKVNTSFIMLSTIMFVSILIGVSVERRNMPPGTFVDSSDAAKGSKHACVKATGISFYYHDL
jgi:hypothetical protein